MNAIQAQGLTYHERIEASTLADLRDWHDTLVMLFEDAEDHCQHALATELSHRETLVHEEIERRLAP